MDEGVEQDAPEALLLLTHERQDIMDCAIRCRRVEFDERGGEWRIIVLLSSFAAEDCCDCALSRFTQEPEAKTALGHLYSCHDQVYVSSKRAIQDLYCGAE